MKPESFMWAKNCWLCKYRDIEARYPSPSRSKCKLHNFVFDYTEQMKERLCDDFIFEDEENDDES